MHMHQPYFLWDAQYHTGWMRLRIRRAFAVLDVHGHEHPVYPSSAGVHWMFLNVCQ